MTNEPDKPERMRWDECLDRIPADRPFVGVEVGVWRGDLSRKLLEARPELTIHLVDEWTPQSQGKRLTGICPPVQAMAIVVGLQHKFGQRCAIHRGRSISRAACTRPQSVDFVFIDARHNYLSVSQDIAAWLPKVRPGGWIGGHDYDDERFPGVRQAVDEKFGAERVERGADATWFVRVA